MRINITIPDDLLGRFDIYCKNNSYDRSEYMRKLLRDAMGTTPVKISEPVTSTSPPKIEPIKKTPPAQGWCNLHVAHEFVAGKKYDVKFISYEDENGTEVVKDKWACDKCIDHYKALGQGRLIYL